MKRLVDYDDSATESDVSSNEDEVELNENELLQRDVKATINFLLCQVAKKTATNIFPPNANSLYEFDRQGYRDMVVRRISMSSTSGSDSDDSSLEVSDNDRSTVGHDDSEDSDCLFSKIVAASNRRKKLPVKPGRIVKTKGEFGLEDLPPIENLRISVPQTVQFSKLGHVSSIVDNLVVILSDQNSPALDQDTLIFTEDRQSVGKIFETFGPVIRPFYSIRFNGVDEIEELNLKVGTTVFYLPDNGQYTRTVFTDALRLIKGTDASWEDNNEPPTDVVEFSDDEEERRWRARRRGKGSQRSSAADASNGSVELASVENAPAAKKRLKAKRRGGGGGVGGFASSRRNAGTHATNVYSDGQNYTPYYPPSTSFSPQYYQQQRNSSPYADSPMPLFRPRNPVWAMPGNRFNGAGGGSGIVHPPPFQPNIPPPNVPNANSWMWMSENEFRLPPPPLPTGFGRTRMQMPRQGGPVRLPGYTPPPLMLNHASQQASSVGPPVVQMPPFLLDNRYVQRND